MSLCEWKRLNHSIFKLICKSFNIFVAIILLPRVGKEIMSLWDSFLVKADAIHLNKTSESNLISLSVGFPHKHCERKRDWLVTYLRGLREVCKRFAQLTEIFIRICWLIKDYIRYIIILMINPNPFRLHFRIQEFSLLLGF